MWNNNFLKAKKIDLLILDDIHNFAVEYDNFYPSKTAGEAPGKLYEIHQSVLNNELLEYPEELPYARSLNASNSIEPGEPLPPISEVMTTTGLHNETPSFKILTDKVSL